MTNEPTSSADEDCEICLKDPEKARKWTLRLFFYFTLGCFLGQTTIFKLKKQVSPSKIASSFKKPLDTFFVSVCQ